jgi:hypothetical protein
MQSPDDILVVQNIDVDCHDVTVEYKKKISYGAPDVPIGMAPQAEANEEDIMYEFNHSDGFQSMYGGNIFNIRPGETRRLPRYIAEHYAKHLIDHLLQKKSEKLGKPNIVNDIKERTELLKQIIISEELLLGDYTPANSNMDSSDNGSKTLREEEIEVSDQLRGFEVKEQETITLEDIKNAPEDDTVKVGNETKTRAELMAECKSLGIPISRNDTAINLISKIKSF